MLTIRLQRAGKKNKPEYRIVLAEKTAASQKKFTEVLGSYNPHTKNLIIRDQERLNYWKDEQHVELSATVNNLLVTKGIIKGDKTKAFTIPKKEVVEEAPAPEAKAEVSAETTAETSTEETPTAEAVEETSTEVVEEAPVETPAEPVVEATAPEVAQEAPAETPEVVAEAPKEEAPAEDKA